MHQSVLCHEPEIPSGAGCKGRADDRELFVGKFRVGPGGILETIGGLAPFILLLETVGFLLSIALLTAFLLRVVEREDWITTLTVAVANAGALYIVFKVLLGVSLPKNIFGF